MILTPEKFFFRFGLRKINYFVNPKVYTWNSFNLPKYAIFHYNSFDNSSFGPDPKDSMWNDNYHNKKLFLRFINELVDGGTHAIKRGVPFLPLVKDYLPECKKRFVIVKDFSAVGKQPDIPWVYNYDCNTFMYNYPKLPISAYNRWKDKFTTMLVNVNTACEEYKDRNHFIVLDMPDDVTNSNKLKTWSLQEPNSTMLQFYKDYKDFNLLELWKFFNKNCKSIIRDKLSINNFNKIYIVLRYKNKWTLLNLAYLFKWIKKDKGEEDSNIEGLMTTYSFDRMQRLFLALVVRLQEQAAIKADEDDSTEIEELRVKGITNRDIEGDEENLNDDDLNELDKKEKERETDEQSKANLDLIINDNSNKELEDIYKEEEEDNKANDIMYSVKSILLKQGDDDVNAVVPTRKRKTDLLVTDEELHNYIYNDSTAEDILKDIVTSYRDESTITSNDYRLLMKSIDEIKNIQCSYCEGRIKDFIKVTDKDLALDEKVDTLPDSINVEDKSMLHTTLQSFDTVYNKKLIKKDIAGMIYSIQKAGFILTDYYVDNVNSVTGAYEVHNVKLKPIGGNTFNLSFRVPKINDRNQFVINGISYRLRKQVADLPIVKIAPNVVTLSSYYGKVFVKRSEIKSNDEYRWLNDKISLASLTNSNPNVLKAQHGNVYDNLIHVPRVYSSLSTMFTSISLKHPMFKTVNLDFNYKDRKNIFGPNNISKYEKDGSVVCGFIGNGDIVTVTKDDKFIAHTKLGDKPLGYIFELVGVDRRDAPVDFSYLKVFKTRFPVGLILGYFIGLENLLKLLKVKYKTFERKNNPKIESNEWVLTFKDKKLVFNKEDKVSSLIMGGFKFFKNSVKLYNMELFNKQDVYLNILENRGIGVSEIREIENLNSLFVDPITKGVLEDMNEPVTFLALLIRASELLKDDSYPDDLDMRYKRIRGYERFAGAVYNEFVKSIKNFRNKNIRGNGKLDMNPFAVWTNISEDTSKITVSDINPMEHLKQEEAITMTGNGGMSKEALTETKRPYHKSHIGTISDATVSSGDVGINTYSCTDPSFRNLRGRSDFYDMSKGGAARFLATTSLASVGMENEDPKRTNFTNGQYSHTVRCDAYKQAALRTGYESMIAHRCKEPFAITAKKKCKVISCNDKGIIVEDEDGLHGYQLGTQYGTSEGTYYDHKMVTLFKKGDVINVGEPIVYNEGFFEKDILNPRQIIWKSSFLVKTALLESAQTLEDSTVISKKVSSMFTTSTIKIRDFVLEFKQNVRELKKEGTFVNPNDVLMIIEDEITSEYNMFDKETIKSLQRLSNKAPRAKYKGTIDRIEMYYNGEIKDMSPTLKTLADHCDTNMKDICLSTNKAVCTGKVDREYRVEGNPLMENTVNIKIFIKVINGAGVGDKGVVGSQLKTTIAEVMDYEMCTETGEPIDCIFGFKSVFNRVVLSPASQGTSNTLLKLIADKACKIYFGE